MPLLTPEQLAALQAIDTPTICNAVETFHVRGDTEGFMGMDIRCLYPELGTMVGYALTVLVDSTTPGVKGDEAVWQEWVQAMHNAPKPIVLVFKDVGPQPRKSAHAGEVMATLARRFNTVGIVTDGGLRDIHEVRALGLHYFAAGIVPSHGTHRLLEVNVPVTLDGVAIEPGDLVHGDVNGVTTIPLEIADRVADAAQQIREREAVMLNYIKSDEFNLEDYFKRHTQH